MAVKYTLVPETVEKPSVLENIPKRYRKRAEELLSYLENLKQTDDERVVYEGGETGSYLIDLLKYFLYPEMLKLQRPLDATKFGILLKERGVPDTILGRVLKYEKNSAKPTSHGPIKWKRL
jgi:hypothetical protein